MTKPLRPSAGIFFLCAIGFILLPAQADAALKVCNRTSYVLYTAEGWSTGADNLTKGWTRIAPGDCATPIAEMLTAHGYYLYARSSQAHSGTARAWGGSVNLCAKDTNFSLDTSSNSAKCVGSDAFTMPFAQVDTHRMQSWTATLTESAAIRTDDDARNAGIDRLLRDNGYKTGNASLRVAALNRFKAKMKLAPRASAADLFDALETSALKAASPAGYSICNDTAGEIWTALGFRTGSQSLAAGWWKVPPGACAHALTEPLKQDKVYVHAEGHDKPLLVTGPDKFCVTNITFTVSDAANCKKRGLDAVGFAATNTKGHAGYTVHIGNNGLLPPPSQASIPK